MTRSLRNMLLTESSGSAAQKARQSTKYDSMDIVQITIFMDPSRSSPLVLYGTIAPSDGDIR